ncbi:hypothetical protein MHJ63_08855 [Pseudoglutamicibacter albus]|uniref:hypothetical protein n=1 Tax=Pseudoglutamicibacter albus TaxID=98671 RepID=UPI001EF6EA89|nr:hypothetical protein [Pseudoglutamicibacter albus]MCG7305369.1 hypothetical protein [Pseudoglutamicibacter albus]
MITSPMTLTRSVSGWILGIVVLAFGAFAAIDAFARGFFYTGVATSFGTMALVMLIAWTLILPRLVVEPEAVVVHNATCVVRIPWGQLREAQDVYFVELTDTDGVVTRVWSAPVQGMGQRRKALRAKASDADLLRHGVDPKQIKDREARLRDGKGISAQVMRYKDAQLKAVDAGDLVADAVNAEVTKTWLSLQWIMLGVVALATIVMLIIA